MTRNRCQNQSLDWCPLSGTRVEWSNALPYRAPCQNRMRRRLLLDALRASPQPQGQRCRQSDCPGCKSSWPG